MPATTYSSFWGPQQDAYSLLVNRAPRLGKIKHHVNEEQFNQAQALLNALIGAAPGVVATRTRKRALGTTTAQNGGGLMTVETVTDINRATVAADVTLMKEFLVNVRRSPATYPRDLSGNGGRAFTPG